MNSNTYKAYYQRHYRRENKEKIRAKQIEIYNQYKAHYLPCIFCNSLVQLNNAINHLRTSKCKAIQNQNLNNKDELLLEYKKRINEMRSNIRLNDDSDDDIIE